MPAELDRRADGTAALVYVGETPWHREGHRFDQPPTIEEALEAAGLDFEVRTEPIYRKRTIVAGDAGAGEVIDEVFEEVKDARVTVRTDRNEVLGVVGSRYTPLQNKDAFAVLRPLIDEGLLTIETAGALRGGRDVWVLGRFHVESDLVQEVFGTEIVPYALISNNHAGTRQVIVQETPIRVVCANTLGAATRRAAEKLDRAFGIRHTASVEAKTVDAALSLWGDLVARYENVARQYQLLKATYLDEALFRKLVLDLVAPIPQKPRGEPSKQYEAAVRRAETKRAKIEWLWDHGKGHTGDRSAWEAYNAVVEAIDHDEELFRTRGSRLQSLYDGALGRTKQAVLDELVAYAASVA